MERLREIWENITTSFWFLPSVLVAFSIVLAFIFLTIDQIYISEEEGTILVPFGGAADAARGLLSTIAASLITVISIAFSITILSLQQASRQYSPRVLRNFIRDKGNQIVLGTYLATFTYSLLILRSVRDETDQIAGFIPALSITFGFLLALTCVGMLIYFISHVATSLQVENIVKNVHTVLVEEIDNLFPEHIDEAVDAGISGEELFNQLKGPGPVRQIKSKNSGFVHSFDDYLLAKLKSERVKAVFVLPLVGDFIAEDQVIIKISENETGEEYDPDVLIKGIILRDQRSIEQDPLFALNQLVDIALRALSPGINDPTTAEYCLFQLRDALCRLAGRKFPPSRHIYEDNPVVFIFNRPTWHEFVDAAFNRIRRSAESYVGVTGIIIEQLHRLAPCVPEGNRSEPLRKQLNEVRDSVKRQSFNERDTDTLLRQIDEAEKIVG